MRYAMIPINRKYDRQGNLVVRRVLVSYESKSILNGIAYYDNTRFIEKDPYFYNTHSSHQYTFDDEEYSLDSVDGESFECYTFKPEIFQRRKYHIINEFCIDAIEFEAESDEEAIKRFNERNELR